jgi:poly(hydroxyalkanoate) depolymerase family esterase
MSFPTKHELLEATRLTRAGRLGEATAMLQQALGVLAAANGPVRAGSRPVRDGLGKTLQNLFAKAQARAAQARAPQAGSAKAEVKDPGRFLERSFSNEAGTRPYKLYVPASLGGGAAPLLVMLHGCTQSPEDFAAGTRMNALAEAHGWLVAYPAQTASANNAKCWNWFNEGDQRRGAGEPSLIAGITRQVMAQHAVDPARIYVAGMSAGGAAAAILADAYPDLYAAVGVHSGLACGSASDLPSAFAAMKHGAAQPARRVAMATGRLVPAIVFHGARDSTVHPGNADAVVAQIVSATPLQVSEQSGRVPGGHAYRRILHSDKNGKTMLEQWVVEGGGHAWSGGSAAGTFTDPLGPDASGEMLRFFLEHRHPSA